MVKRKKDKKPKQRSTKQHIEIPRIEQREPHQNRVCSDVLAVPTLHVIPVVLLLNDQITPTHTPTHPPKPPPPPPPHTHVR